MNKKILSLLLIFLGLATNIYAQFSFSQATSYIHMAYDSLDEILSKKGFTFVETKEIGDNETRSTWKNPKGFRIGIISTPDTISLVNNEINIGYTDVAKKSLVYLFSGTATFEVFSKELKEKLQKFQSWTEATSIITTYKNDRYFVRVSKEVLNSANYYFIRIDDLAYEVLEKHFK